ncbi:flagellar filament capping protein FliD [Pantoea sp. B65]|uniref:flagellar filament capping protein FliD n=1 Tax=Pantoea sp. B65 TaxID=2813359 RepID=UPI0039B3B93C
MASISTLGIGSGLDLTTILDSLETAEKIPLTLISDQQTSYTAKLSAYGTLKSALEKFQTATDTLASADTFSAATATSSSSAFSATTGSDAVAGKYTISVSTLATAQTLTSASKTDKTTAIASSASTITIQQDNGDDAVTIDLTAANSSLTGIRDAINAADAGVTASIIQVSSGSYVLSVTSDDTGVDNAMSISVSGDSTLQSFLGYDASASSNGMTESVEAVNAELTVNNVAIESSSNSLTEVIQGITLELSDVTSGNQTLTVTKDTSEALDAITEWVDAYNTLQDSFSSLTKYTAVDAGTDEQDSSNGALLGDSTLRTIQTQLKSLLTNASSSSTFKSLSQIGITTDTGTGQLELDSDALEEALASDADGIKEMIIGDGSTTGIATTMSTRLTGWLADDGILQAATDGVSSTLNDLTDQYNAMSTRIDNIVARYKAQFTQLDVLISQLNTTSDYLTQQFSSSDSSSSSS